MHDHRVHARLLQQHHVAREIARHLVVAHRMAAIFHDDDGVVVAQHMRQRLHQDFGLLQGAVLAGVGHVAVPKLEGLRRS